MDDDDDVADGDDDDFDDGLRSGTDRSLPGTSREPPGRLLGVLEAASLEALRLQVSRPRGCKSRGLEVASLKASRLQVSSPRACETKF